MSSRSSRSSDRQEVVTWGQATHPPSLLGASNRKREIHILQERVFQVSSFSRSFFSRQVIKSAWDRGTRLWVLGWAGGISHETCPLYRDSKFGTLGLYPTPGLLQALTEQVAPLLPSQGLKQMACSMQGWGAGPAWVPSSIYCWGTSASAPAVSLVLREGGPQDKNSYYPSPPKAALC